MPRLICVHFWCIIQISCLSFSYINVIFSDLLSYFLLYSLYSVLVRVLVEGIHINIDIYKVSKKIGLEIFWTNILPFCLFRIISLTFLRIFSHIFLNFLMKFYEILRDNRINIQQIWLCGFFESLTQTQICYSLYLCNLMV